MATVRQIFANRQNSQKSSGPVSETGKQTARANSLKHGLTGAGIVLSETDQDAVQIRMVQWRPNYEIQTAEQEWLFEQVVTHSVRIDRCHEQESVLRSSESQRAALCWEEDRRAEIEEIASKLAKNPSQIGQRLQITKQGTEWMLERWATLSLIYYRHREWTEAQIALAHDLLGTPLELRDGAPFRDPAEIASREIDRLKNRLNKSLNQLDEIERDAAIAGNPITLSKAMNNLRRYEATCRRNYQTALNQLQESIKANQPVEPAVAPPPVTKTKPESPPTKQTQWDSGQVIPVSAVPTSNRLPEMPHHTHSNGVHLQS